MVVAVVIVLLLGTCQGSFQEELYCNSKFGTFYCGDPSEYACTLHYVVNGPNKCPEVSAGCELLGNETQLDLCQINKTEPHFMAFNERRLFKSDLTNYKLCCRSFRCNNPSDFGLDMLPFIKDNHKSLDNNDILTLIFVVIIVTIAFVACRLYYLHVRVCPFTDDYRQTIDENLTDAVGDYVVSKQHGIKPNGLLTLKQITAVMADMASEVETVLLPVLMDLTVRFEQPLLISAAGYGHTLVHAQRKRPLFLGSMLFRLIEHGPYMFSFNPEELLELFDEAKDVFFSDPSLIRIPGPCVIIGDLRGSYADVHRWLMTFGWPPKTKLLFLGNTIDRDEAGSLETIALIASLKIAFPDDVFLLRGITETLPFMPKRDFHIRILRALGGCINRMCCFLPTAALVMDKVLVVPSGISPRIVKPSDFDDIARPTTLENMSSVQRHFIFNQPSTKVRMYRPNHRSRGDYYGVMAVQRMRHTMQVNTIIRGGCPLQNGFLPSWDYSLVTIWSAPSKGTRIASVLIVNNKLEITPVLMEMQDIVIISKEAQTLSKDKASREKASKEKASREKVSRELSRDFVSKEKTK